MAIVETRAWSLSADALEHSWDWRIPINSQFYPEMMGNVFGAALSPDGRHVGLASHSNLVLVFRSKVRSAEDSGQD